MGKVYSKRDSQLRGQPTKTRQAQPQRRRAYHLNRPDTRQPYVEIKYITTDEALRLAEDAGALRLARKLVEQIDPLSIMDTLTQGERDTAGELVRNLLSTLRNWERYAVQKLAREHLLGEHKPQRSESAQP